LGREKSETPTEILVGIMDEEDEFEDLDVHGIQNEKAA
jgi:hypothetical protein